MEFLDSLKKEYKIHMKRREKWLNRHQYIRNYSVPKDLLTSDLTSEYYPPNHLEEHPIRVHSLPDSIKKVKVIVDVHSPSYQLEQEHKRQKELIFLK